MGRIKLLDQTVIDQIAAGEIIERPASVIKELVENSIDAGATDIVVEIVHGGKTLIRVVDNGFGIAPEDLPLALKSHATSKLTSAEDLAEVETLGFRGEALASIASVSEMYLASRTKNCDCGTVIKYEYGRFIDMSSVGMANGTVVEAKDLFKNLPARRKFLKSDSIESSAVQETMLRFALAFPAISFRLTSGKRAVLSAPPATDMLRRIRDFYGDDIANAMAPISHEEPELTSIMGFTSLPPTARANTALQYTFLNGRFIRDKSITAAIKEAYRGKLVVGQNPIVFIMLNMPAQLFDVNVHPTKIEVRFRESNRVFGLVLRAISSALEGNFVPPVVSNGYGISPEPDGDTQNRIKSSILDFYSRRAALDEPRLSFSDRSGDRPLRGSSNKPEERDISSFRPTPLPESEVNRRIGNWYYIGSLADTYLMFSENEDLIVVDQHAMHERIMYERLSARPEQSIQRLLIPHAVEMTPDEYELIDSVRSRLTEAGFEIEPFGERTIAIHTAPEGFPAARCGEILQRSIAELAGEPSSKDEAGLSLIQKMACHAAIKAGDRLSFSEVQSLIADWRTLEGRGATCPHGRPVLVKIPLSSVAKWFKRT